MARNNHIINSFSAGEVSPKFFGRTELQQYNNSAEKIYNSLVAPQGGAGNRPGTHFVQKILQADNSTTPENAICIPFSGADGTSWMLVLTTEPPDQSTGYAGPPSTATTGRWEWYAINTATYEVEQITAFFEKHTGISTPWYLTNYYTGFASRPNDVSYSQTGDVMFVASPSFRPITITYDSTPTSASYSKFLLRSFPRYESFTPFTPADVGSSWRQMPFTPSIVSTTSLSIAWTNNGGFGTDVIAPGAGSNIAFTDDWVGKYLKFEDSVSGEAIVVMVWYITSSTSAKVVVLAGSMTTGKTFGGATATRTYQEGYWDDVKGWPRAVTHFEQRTMFGGTATYPDTIWGSEQNNFYKFDEHKLITDADYAAPVAASDPFSMTLKADVLTKIQWMSPGKTVATGTLGREFIVQGPSPTESIGPTNLGSQAETAQGSARAMAVRVENAVIFMQKDRRTLRELAFNFDEDSFKASNISILAEHMGYKFREAEDFNGHVVTDPYFIQLARQNEYIWILNNVGTLCCATREREQNMTAWSYHELAGYGPELNSVATFYSPSIKCIATLPGATTDDRDEGAADELWMIVERGSPDGTRYLSVEKLGKLWARDTIWGAEPKDMWYCEAEPKRAPVYLDCAFITDAQRQVSTYSSGPGVIAGLPYGDNAIVSAVVNGHYLGEFTVASGAIDISASIEDYLNDNQDDDRWQAIVGFKYSAQIVPVCPEVPAVTGSSQGQIRRVDQISVHFHNTSSASVGRLMDDEEENTPVDSVEEVGFEPGENQDEPIPLFTGIKTLNFPQGYERRPRILVQTDKPLPMHVTHIIARMIVAE